MASTTRGAPTGQVPEWTIREQLILASAVQRSGDQNWVSVSRAVKPLVEDVRPTDYLSQKNCALQYSAMLDKASTPKRKRSSDGTPEVVETVEEQIVRHLTEKRITELTRSISETKDEYFTLKKEVEQIERGEMDDNILQIWQDIQAEIISKEEGEGRNGREVIPVKLKSPTSSSLLKYQEQLKLRKQISSPSTSPIQDAAPKATEVERPLKTEEKVIGRLEDPMEKMDITQMPPGAIGGAKIIIKKEVPSLDRHGDTSMVTEEESPLPKAITTPKEERFGGLPLHVACTESPIPQFTADMHIILQQPNTALMRVARVLPTSLVQTALGLVSPVATLNTKPTTKPTVVSEKPPLQIQPQDIPLSEPIVHPSTPEALPKLVAPSYPLPSSETIAPTTKTPELTPLSEMAPRPPPVPPVSLSPPLVTATVLASTLQTPTPPPETTITSPTVEPKSLPAGSLAEEPTPLEPEVPMEDEVREEEGKEKETEMDTSQPGESSAADEQREESPKMDDAPTTALEEEAVIQPPDQPPHHQPPPNKLVSPKSPLPENPPSPKATKSPPASPKPEPVTSPAEKVLSPKGSKPPAIVVSEVKSPKSPWSPRSPQSPFSPLTAPVRVTRSSEARKRDVTASGDEGEQVQQKDTAAAAAATPASPESVNVSVKTSTPPGRERGGEKERVKALSREMEKELVVKPLSRERERERESGMKPSSREREREREKEKEKERESGTKPSSRERERESGTKPSSREREREKEKERELGMRPSSREREREKKEKERESGTKPSSRERERESGMKPSSREREREREKERESGMKPSSREREREREKERERESGTKPSSREREKERESGTKPSSRERERESERKPLSRERERGREREKEREKERESGESGGAEEDDTPMKSRRQSFKKQWVTRSRKRKADVLEEGPSVESTDMESEEEPSSLQLSAVPSPAPSQGDTDPELLQAQKQWRKAIMLVWRHAAQHKYANLFLHPVKEDDAPGYREAILSPMDLSSIKKKIETGLIKTDIEFQRDMLLMFQNAFMYNSSDHDVYLMAEEMRVDVMDDIQAYLATQLQLMVDASVPKTLRSREGRKIEQHEESVFSPAAKKRRTRADD